MFPLPAAAAWLALVAQCALFGGLLFDLACLRGRSATTLGAATVHLRQSATRVTLVAVAAASLLQALWPAREAGELGAMLLGARLALAAATWALARRGRAGAALATAGSLLALQTAGSRFTQRADPILPLLADLAHLAAAATWIGGVARLALLAPAAARSGDTERLAGLGEAIRRFSPLAVGAVMLLALTGLTQANLVLDSVEALIQTDYGRTLTAKIALFGVLLALGGLHQQALAPRLAEWRGRLDPRAAATARQMTWSLAAEIIAAVVALAAAAAMAAWPGP